MPKGDNAVHLHIDNATALGEIFEITPERFEAAAMRHPEIAANLTVTFGTDGAGLDAALSSTDVLLAWNFDRQQLKSRAPNLRLIQVQGAGINHLLPIDWLPNDVVLTNSSGAHGMRASEYLIMAVLALNSSLPAMATSQRQQEWAPIHNSSVQGKTVLIYGVGAIGGSCAMQAKKFDMHVIGIRRSGTAHSSVDEMHTPEALHALLPRADFVVVTAPHTQETEKVFGAQEFGLMKKGAGFVGYSRPNLIDFDALCVELKKNTLSAIVDVFDQEPLPSSSELWQMPNLIITPHSSSNDPERHASRSLDILFSNIEQMMDGGELVNIVDPQLQY